MKVLPECLRRSAEEVARFTKTPVVSSAVVGLSVAALAIGKKARIQARPGLTHNPALFHVLIATSGERKSPVFKTMTAPLENRIEQEMETYKVEPGRIKVANQVTDALLADLKKQGASPKISDKERKDIIDRMAEQETERIPSSPSPRMFTSDITEKRLFQRMHERGGEYAVLSGEGRPVMNNILGRYSGKDRTGDGIYLAGITEDTITRDRVGNENGPEDRMIINPCNGSTPLSCCSQSTIIPISL
uniref:DUF3987 domain-containing protein n=1 Tax=Candidatus Kentrum sp. TUN TaxID=2126343 RepID=A0A451ADZ0_9GAMM|nr:MAG: Protein of unknown function (DUF3987) [Candidatus Kentron sp. TUN]